MPFPFDQAELNALPPPDHLRRLASTTVADIAATVCATFGRAMPLAVAEQLARLMDSHRLGDARQLANACERAGALGVAAALDAVLLAQAHSAD
jgi:DNA-binding NtrC family response regulator